jgi:excisionase family DNA binding protein
MGADAANLTGTRTVLPPPDTAVLADLAALLGRDDGPLTLVGSDGHGVLLPQQIRAVLIQATASFVAGRAVTVATLEQRLTTQQAADLLGVSRPTLVKILNRHEIPYERPGRQHRRIRLVDVLDYRDRRRHGDQDRTGA